MRRLRLTPKPHMLLLALGTSFVVACGGGSAQATPTTAAVKAKAPTAGPTATRPALPPSSPQAVPKPSPAVTLAKPSPVPAAGQEYAVAEGDTMAKIAERFYGDPTLWRRIYDANKDAIGDDPDRIKVGTKLTIPPKPQ